MCCSFTRVLPNIHAHSSCTSDSLKNQLEFVEDIAIDVPDVFKFLGAFISRFLAKEYVSLAQLVDMFQGPLGSVKHFGKRAAPLVVAEALKGVAEKFGEHEARHVASNQDLAAFWYGAEDMDVAAWAATHGIEWVLSAAEEGDQTPMSASSEVPEEQEGNFLTQLASCLDTMDGASLVEWCAQRGMAQEDPDTIQAVAKVLLSYLVTVTIPAEGGKLSALESSHFADMRALMEGKMAPVFLYLVADKPADPCSLHILYACQVYCYELGFPPQLLAHLFRLLDEFALVARDVMHQWKAAPLLGHPGNREAIKQLSGWFKSLE
jgi:hypothetical protein